VMSQMTENSALQRRPKVGQLGANERNRLLACATRRRGGKSQPATRKLQIPNTKSQVNSKDPNLKILPRRCFELWISILQFTWSLEPGIWDFDCHLGHMPCSLSQCANSEQPRPKSRIRPGYFLSLPALQSSAGRKQVSRGNEPRLPKVRQANSRTETGSAQSGGRRIRRRNSAQTERERIAVRRSYWLHQSAHDPIASLAIAFANVERTQDAARKRTGI
jgi:hypothetical protein